MYKNIQSASEIVKNSLAKLWQISKRNLILITLVMLFAQLFELIALLLPLKIILIFSSKQIPKYLTDIAPTVDLNQWIWILLMISIVFFLMTLLLDVYVKRKVKSFSGYYNNTKAIESYPIPFSIENLNEIFKIFANLSQVIFGLLLILFIFPFVIILWMIFVLFQYVAIKHLMRSNNLIQKFMRLLALDQQQLFRNFMDFNFLVVFVFILLSFMLFEQENQSVFFIFLSILVARKVFSAAVQSFNCCFRITLRLSKS